MNKKELVQAAIKMGMKQNDKLLRKLAEVEKEELLEKKVKETVEETAK